MDPLVKEASDTMGKSLDSFVIGLGKLRSGRANPALLNGLQCDYYGDKMDISALCAITMPEPRQLLVRPYSREDLKSVAAAIGSANLGVNPQIEAVPSASSFRPSPRKPAATSPSKPKSFPKRLGWPSETSAVTISRS